MKDDFIFFWHGDEGYPNCEFGQWYMRHQTMDVTEIVSRLPFLQHWLDDKNAGRPKVFKVNCCEQWMMFCKAVMMKDNKTAAAILKLAHPRDQKKAGRKIKPWDEALWVKWRKPVVFEGNWAKFTQHADLKAKMLSFPKDKRFVEASPLDQIWGIGRAEDDPLSWEEKSWNGLNLLGEVHDEVRAKLS